MTSREPIDDGDELADRPSRSARKRAAEYMQKLGVRLVGLRETQLEALELPEELREALREARRLRGQSALARQRQYIGRLMRDLDPGPIEAALDRAAGLAGPRGKIPR
ncbi:MAG TPA: ribosome biogenesis factor YjgA [Steroidobacteraceae bacterium]|nr:ribosome biogenesis factor YjgA [Steroidobacteraceae bacterium]